MICGTSDTLVGWFADYEDPPLLEYLGSLPFVFTIALVKKNNPCLLTFGGKTNPQHCGQNKQQSRFN